MQLSGDGYTLLRGYMIGFGSENADFHVYIDKRPPLDQYQHLSECRPLLNGELNTIVQMTGNHWRKIFNVYAKLLFVINSQGYSSWQAYRDYYLLQKGVNHTLRFDLPIFKIGKESGLHIVMGKTYLQSIAKAQPDILTGLHWSDQNFAINYQFNLIVCPYFDYRQLSNLKIEQLHTIIRPLY